MPTEDELREQEEAEAAAMEQEDKGPVPVVDDTPAFDRGAETARIREQVEAEYATRYKPAKEEEPNIDDLLYTDPAAYRAAIAKQTRDAIMGEVAPLLDRLNTDLVTNELTEGLTNAGKAYVKDFASGIPIAQLQGNPKLKELLRNAAENVDRKSQPRNIQGERPTTQGNPLPVPQDDYNLYSRYLDKADIDAILKETKGR